MAQKREKKAPRAPALMASLASGVFEALDLGKRAAGLLRGSFEREMRAWTEEVLLLLFLRAWAALGLLMVFLGLFYLLIDMAGLPRGLVFLGGGLLISALSLLLALFARKAMEAREH